MTWNRPFAVRHMPAPVVIYTHRVVKWALVFIVIGVGLSAASAFGYLLAILR